MSAIALLDVSGADAAFAELVGLAQVAAAQWRAGHPDAVSIGHASTTLLLVRAAYDAPKYQSVSGRLHLAITDSH